MFMKKLNERTFENIEMWKIISVYSRSYGLKAHSYYQILVNISFSMSGSEEV